MNNKQQVKSGFTLIELLVVVLIIGILAAVAVPQYQFAVLKSRFVQAKIMVSTLARAQEVYYLANGEYAPHISQLDIDIPASEQEEALADTSNTRYFSWGSCWVAAGDEYGERVACDLNEGVALYKYLEHGNSSYKGKFICRGLNTDLNSLQNKLCKQESGLSAPSSSSSKENRTDWLY